MKRLLILVFLCASTALSFAQASKTSENEYTSWLRMGLGFDFTTLSEELSSSKGLSQTGVTWFKPEIGVIIHKYATVDLGAGFGKYRDYDPFSQNVTYPVQNPTQGVSVSSKTFALDWYYKVGGRIPILKWLHTEIGIGHRFFNITREIPDCVDCDRRTVYKKAKMFANIKICFDTKKNMTYFIGYDYFFPKIIFMNDFEPSEVFVIPSGVKNCITFGLCLEGRN